MAGNVKGITIEFRGDTTKLEKALRTVRSDAKGIDKELRDINTALKFNPRNTELLAQKQTVLKQKVAQTSKSLEELKQVQAQMDKDPSVDKNSEEYRKLRREIVTTESKLKHFQGELAKTAAKSSRLYRVGQAFEDAGKKIEGAGRKLSGLSRAAGAVTLAIGGVTYKAGQMADDLNTLSKQTGISTSDLQMYAASADLLDVSVEAMAKSHQKLKKNMLGAMDGTNEQAQYFEQLGISITNSDGSLRDANDVFDETIAALGKMENETERDAIAMAIFGKSANELNPLIEDGGETYAKVADIMSKHGLEPVSQEELDKANAFNDQIDTIKLVFTQAMQIIGTKIAGYLLPLMEKVTEVAGNIAGKIAGLSGGKLAKLGGLSAALTALSPALIVAGKLIAATGGKMKQLAGFVSKVAMKFPKFGKALGFLTNPIALAVAAIAGIGLAIGKSGKSSDELVKIFDTMVKKGIKKVGELIPKVVEIVKDIGKTIAKNAPVLLKGVMTLLETVLKLIAKYGPSLLQGAVKLFTSFVKAIPEVLPKLLKAVTDLIGSVVKALPTLIPLLLKAAVNLFMAIVKAIPQIVTALKAALPQIGSAMLTYFKELLGKIKNVFANIGTWFGNKFAGAVSAIKEKFKGIATWFGEKWTAIKGKFANVKEWFGTKFGGAWKAIKSKFSGWGEFWGGLWGKIKKKFSSIGSNISIAISTSIKGGLNKLLSKLEEKLNHVVVTINSIISGINKYTPLNIGMLSAVQLPRLAKGGVLNGARAVIAGEAGPEAIIPLDKLFAQMDKMAATIQGSGEGITINVYGAQGQSVKALADEVERRLIEAQKRRRLAWQ